MYILTLFSVLGLSWAGPVTYCGETFRLAASYGANMVLQREPVNARVWGYAFNEGDQVTLTLTDESGQSEVYETDAIAGDNNGSIWRIEMTPKPAGGPYSIELSSGDCVLQYDNILFGDVWLCSGQSNMAHTMNNVDDPEPDIENSVNYPNIRIFQVNRTFSDVALEDITSVRKPWNSPNPGNIGSFSAVCYFFGTHLYDQYQVPIGLVQSDWGGTRIEAWSSPAALEVCFPDGPPEREDKNAASVLYNAMIHPLIPMPVFGVIWYQGETNADMGNFEVYGCAIREMVKDWRASWFAETDTMEAVFPFGEVQLAPEREDDESTGWQNLRWHQTYEYGYVPNAQLERFFMAVAVDLPDFDSPQGAGHPRYKRQIAQRLALGAYRIAYDDDSNGTAIGPMVTNVAGTPEQITITIDEGNAELEQRGDPSTQIGYEVCCSADSTVFCDGDNTAWVLADITSVSTGTVVISQPCTTGQFATGIRYLWRKSPCKVLEECPIYAGPSGNSLPAHPLIINGSITPGPSTVN